jgi:hypothetical protein
MAKKATGRTRKAKQPMRAFDVYQQADGALVVLPAGDEPDDDIDPVWSGEAIDEKDAIAEARHSDSDLRNAAAANPLHDPNTPNRLREDVEAETNRRLGITTAPAKRGGRKRSAKRGVKKTKAKATSAKKKSTRR